MAFSNALYYPWIDIRDEAWLKTAILYWDSVQTIVPESIERPYSTETARFLEDAGFLRPLRVRPDMEEIEVLADDAIAYIETSEAAEFLLWPSAAPRSKIHVQKLPDRFRRLASIHPEKLPYEIREQLMRMGARSRREGGWLEVDEAFAGYYMTLLAESLSARRGLELLTPLPTAERLATSARLGAQLPELIPNALSHEGPPWWRWRRWREYEARGGRRRPPRTLAQGMLAHLAIERIAVHPETPVDQLLRFKDDHRDELGQFRTKVEHLTAEVNADLPPEAMRQSVLDIYNNEVSPALSNLKRALEGQRIRWLGPGLLKVASLSAAPSAMLVVAGLSVPTALLVCAGLSLIVSGMIYNEDRKELLRSNPYTYLLAMQVELK